MGEVYRASDTVLKRQVALKILPAVFAGDLQRLTRFKREAELLASLSHPNICAVHGLERSGLVIALVMELVEGSDLSSLIDRGPLPPDEALRIAKQMAEALEAAHDHGIIHRDLKPGNVKVREDGAVKVLDFGLAKALDPVSVSDAPPAGPPLASPTTIFGTVIGTIGYMAPEQARGHTVDRHADLWAFGAVLFEMLTGRRAFTGDTSAAFSGSGPNLEPKWSLLPPATPAGVRTLLRRCLEPDPRRRLDSARAARLEIEDALTGPSREVMIGPATRLGSSRLAWALAAIVGAALAATLFRSPPWRGTPLSPETRTDIVTPPTDDPSSFALSPDGRSIVFAASAGGSRRLWLRSLGATAAQPLAGTEGGRHPFWSPDSRSIGYFTDTALRRIDLGGGGPHAVAPASSGTGGTWTTDGFIVFAPSPSSPLMRVPSSGGSPTPVTTFGPQQIGHRWPDALPDGKRFLFYAGGPPDIAGIYVGAVDGSAPTRVTAADSAGVYLPGGWLLWVRGGALVAQPFDAAAGTLSGEPVAIADEVTIDTSERSAVSTAATGLLAYRAAGPTPRRLAWFDRSGRELGTIGTLDPTWGRPRVAPDGRRVVAARTVQGNQDLWLLDGDRLNRFTFDAATDDIAIWSPDGTHIVFTSTRSGGGDLYDRPASGAAPEDLVVASNEVKTPSSWSPDGRFVLYHSTDPQTSSDLWVVPVMPAEGGRLKRPGPPALFLRTPSREVWGAFSPDGRWVAYMSNESGRTEIYVRAFTAGAESDGTQWQVSTAGGIHPVWLPNGKELYYIDPVGAMVAVPIAVNGTTIQPGTPLVLFATRILGGGIDAGQGRQYDVAPDGRFLINTVLQDVDTPITLLQHWRAGATR